MSGCTFWFFHESCDSVRPWFSPGHTGPLWPSKTQCSPGLLRTRNIFFAPSLIQIAPNWSISPPLETTFIDLIYIALAMLYCHHPTALRAFFKLVRLRLLQNTHRFGFSSSLKSNKSESVCKNYYLQKIILLIEYGVIMMRNTCLLDGYDGGGYL